MRKKSRAAAALAACVLVLVLAVGCAQKKQDSQIFLYDSEEEQENMTLTVFGFKADTLNLLAIEDTLHSFMEENPGITITYEGIKGVAYWDALAKRASAGVLDDIIMVDHDRVLEYGEKGLLADLSKVPGLENYADLATGQFRNEDGSVWFLPTCISAYGLYVNYDLLKEDNQDIPTNWEEFAAVCDFYASKGCVPVVANNYSSLRSMIIAKGMYEVYQSDDPEARISAFNNGDADLADQLAPGVGMVDEILSKGWIDRAETLETTQTQGDLALFAQGDRPFMITGAWASPRVMEMDPGFEYGVYPFPVLEDGSTLVVDAATCIAVNAGSEHLDEAMDFLAYLIQPDVMWNYCDSQSSYTPLKDDRVPTDETIVPSVKCLDNGDCVIGSDYRVTLPLDTALVECTNALLQGADAQEAERVLRDALGQER